MTALWTAADAAEATGGDARGDWTATGVSIDTRTIAPGDLFVALTDVRDGHDFVADALEKGASAALVSRVPEGVAGDAPLLVVPDVLAALAALGRAARARAGARVIAVTGSAGKTSTKEMLRHALGAQGRVHAAEASYNNHWGVPLTLARMPSDAEFAVIEIGMNHPGEIAPLARLARPHVALVTTVAAAHLEAFEDVRGIAREKASIFEGLEPSGTAIWNADVGTSAVLQAAAETAGALSVPFGEGFAAEDGVRAVSVVLAGDRTLVKARLSGRELLFKLGAPGRHFAMNALAALAAIRAVGADVDVAAADLAAWSPPEGRGKRRRVVLDAVEDASFELLDDAFNANPASMAAAFEVLAASEPAPRGRRVAILGEMLELGPGERALHAELARHPAMGRIARVHTVGDRMTALHEALPEDRRGRHVARAEDLLPELARLVRPGDVVLVKGSKASRVSLVAEAAGKLGRTRATARRQEAD